MCLERGGMSGGVGAHFSLHRIKSVVYYNTMGRFLFQFIRYNTIVSKWSFCHD